MSVRLRAPPGGWFGTRVCFNASKRHLTPQMRQRFSHNCPDVPKILSLPPRFLYESGASKYDTQTFQRNDLVFDDSNGKPIIAKQTSTLQVPKIVDCQVANGGYTLTWSDGTISQYSAAWVGRELARGGTRQPGNITLWKNLTEADVRSNPQMNIEFDQLLTQDGMQHALGALYQFGILLVTQTPIDDAGQGVAALGAALGGGAIKTNPTTSYWKHYEQTNKTSHSTNQQQQKQHGLLHLDHGTDGPMRTLYGSVWSTTSAGQVDGTSVADSAYGQEALPLHTDMTYLRDPPGLQIFTMVQPAAQGGESVFADGFMAAEQLRETHPRAFDTLSQTIRRYRCIDPETGWHLEAIGPVISTFGQRVVGIRHNDLDRLPDLPPGRSESPAGSNSNDTDEAFYERLDEAHTAWDEILEQDGTRVVVKLQSGDTMVVCNQRCFHGRCSFTSTAAAPRAVRGCYVSQSELNSRFRMAGFDVI